MFYWLDEIENRLALQQERGQLSHALLIHGPVGTGRRYLALSLAARLLCLAPPEPAAAENPAARLDPDLVMDRHPDFELLQPPAEKRSLPIDRVREMIRFLQLTAHQGGPKVALITAAEALTHQAANSLLKTLEEPPAGCNLLLVAANVSRLPATVLSRCQRVRVPLPPTRELLNWPDAAETEDWPEALNLAGGSPLLARDLQRAKFPAEARQMEGDLAHVASGEASPLAIARRWSKLDAELCLGWLYRRTAEEIRRLLGAAAPKSTEHLQIHSEASNMEPAFALLREIGELRRLQGAGLNSELSLAQVLDHWRGGLLREQH